MKIIREAVAGTLESSDVMIRVAPLNHDYIDVVINSLVIKQFGNAIRQTVTEVLHSLDVSGVQIMVDDKGALDCILRARLQTALMRASGELAEWEKLQ
ncbi:citrate lyase acyl carrier protein [Entomohabitans teleogrylli]|uniref:citrate lyase acyl carrier protein n=1 Tax=Entomohabitans teleogrylli TaxID=1384589 RepID=UPI00073D2116|nr:citrate lyase acyl carrier protein [Entomohabitans teleogrylli]